MKDFSEQTAKGYYIWKPDNDGTILTLEPIVSSKIKASQGYNTKIFKITGII